MGSRDVSDVGSSRHTPASSFRPSRKTRSPSIVAGRRRWVRDPGIFHGSLSVNLLARSRDHSYIRKHDVSRFYRDSPRILCFVFYQDRLNETSFEIIFLGIPLLAERCVLPFTTDHPSLREAGPRERPPPNSGVNAALVFVSCPDAVRSRRGHTHSGVGRGGGGTYQIERS
jgi:hypothetical protein